MYRVIEKVCRITTCESSVRKALRVERQSSEQFVSTVIDAPVVSAEMGQDGYGPKDGPQGMAKNIEQVRLLRELAGDEIDIMLECYMGWTLEYAPDVAAPRGIQSTLDRGAGHWR